MSSRSDRRKADRAWHPDRMMEILDLIERNREIGKLLASIGRLSGGGATLEAAKYDFWARHFGKLEPLPGQRWDTALTDVPIMKRSMVSTLSLQLRELRRARRLVVSDPDIMGGDPVFRGTRVPVHMIAELAAKGSTPAELLESYPRLTAEMIRLTPVYAAAYPLRGRPRHQPWRDQKPTHRARRRVDTIAVS